jgi:5-methylcytosine-specific restriction endonuclease McrA
MAYERDRGSARSRGYDARWDKAAAAFKAEHPLCLGCQAIGQVKVAVLVDHVEPHKGDMVKFWDASMWQPSCAWHHDVIKKQLEQQYEQGHLTVSDLWLNSPSAIRLSRQKQARPLGVDGWPTV